jgi:hypothetical protein
VRVEHVEVDGDIVVGENADRHWARSCFSSKILGKARPEVLYAQPEKQLPLPVAFEQCNKDTEKYFRWIGSTPEQEKAFKYLLFAKLDTFDNADQQTVINAFYRVKDPIKKAECLAKRPRRYQDPVDGTHCLSTKTTTLYKNGWHQ